MKNKIFICCWLLLLISCARIPPEQFGLSLRKASTPFLNDDLSLQDFFQGVEKNIEILQKTEKVPSIFQFGKKRQISKDVYLKALMTLSQEALKMKSKQEILDYIAKNFDFYEIFGKEEWGEVFITSYYGPEIPGSRKKTAEYSQPLYKRPSDLFTFQLKEFVEPIPKVRKLFEKINEDYEGQRPKNLASLGLLRGRLEPNDNHFSTIVPYYTREEIDSKSALEGKKLEICYVTPLDAFILQIQGSGTVKFSDGSSIRLGYADQNGHEYIPIGKFLTEHIPLEEMTLLRIIDHVTTLSEEERQNLFNKNPSYVFFHELTSPDYLTYTGTPVISGRTIAADPRFFPKGSLGFLVFESPMGNFENKKITWKKTSRFIWDQDTGGAIKGPYRLDLYWGKGQLAMKKASEIKQWGQLYYLAPKEKFLTDNNL